MFSNNVGNNCYIRDKKKNMTCLNCRNLNLKKIVSMGKQPLSGIFLNKKTYNLKKYPLDLHICKKCNLVQLKKYAKLELMYGSQYGYKTSISKLMIKHKKKYRD